MVFAVIFAPIKLGRVLQSEHFLFVMQFYIWMCWVVIWRLYVTILLCWQWNNGGRFSQIRPALWW